MDAYVALVLEEPRLYRFVFAHNALDLAAFPPSSKSIFDSQPRYLRLAVYRVGVHA